VRHEGKFSDYLKPTAGIFVYLVVIEKSMLKPPTDEFFMKQALQEAGIAFEKNEVPVGAVVVMNGQIIARAHNLIETLNDVTAHAEMQAITAATNYLGGKYLKECSLYVTLEPCTMCGGALFWSQIKKVVYGAMDEKRGAHNHQNIYHPKTEIISGVLAEDCASLVNEFFRKKRN
jgi:tRNA(adenine34) deaminase